MEDTEITTPTESTETVETPQVEEAQAATETEYEVDTAAKTEAYQPNYKYKAYDQELEFDDWVKPLVTKKEIEEKFRDVFSKVQAFDKRNKYAQDLEGEIKTLKPEFEKHKTAFTRLEKILADGDLGNLFKTLEVTDDQIAQYVIHRANLQKMNPEDRQRWEQAEEAKQKARIYEDQYNELNNWKTQQEASRISFERDQSIAAELQKPNVREFVGLYDQRNGQGSFKQRIMDEGYSHFVKTGGDPRTGTGGQNLTVEEATQRVLKAAMYDPESQYGQASQAQQATSKKRAPAPMPNVGKGGGMSPGVKPISSLEELKKYRAANYS